MILNPKTISYMVGGAIVSYFLFQSLEATIIGGVIGIILSFVK